MHRRCSAACPQRHSGGVLHAVEGRHVVWQARVQQEYAYVVRVCSRPQAELFAALDGIVEANKL